MSPEQVLITNGVSQAITLISQAAMEGGHKMICETPGFLGIANAMSSHGHWVETVQRDDEGPLIEQVNRFCGNEGSMLYICPYVHNPTGRNMTGQRARDLASWARKNGAVIIADEIFRDLQYARPGNPGMLSLLDTERTIIVSSLSKTVMTGLRLGWVVSSPSRIKELTRLKKLMDHACPTMVQAMALNILKSGRYEHHRELMAGIYERRMSLMLEWLGRRMPDGVKWTTPEGGFSMMLELPNGYSSVALLLFAVEKGVSFLPGPLFDIDHRYVNGIRLSCAWADEQQIKEGVELLADAISEFIRRPPADSGLSGLGGYQ